MSHTIELKKPIKILNMTYNYAHIVLYKSKTVLPDSNKIEQKGIVLTPTRDRANSKYNTFYLTVNLDAVMQSNEVVIDMDKFDTETLNTCIQALQVEGVLGSFERYQAQNGSTDYAVYLLK